MKRTAERPGALRGPAAVTRTCGSCGRRFACVARSVADQVGLCLRCFERKVRFPGLCQRP
jgi:hypothetical protein